MTVVMPKLSIFIVCVLSLIFPVYSLTFSAAPHAALQVEGRPFEAELHSALQAEGLPFELVCYIKGTPDEIKDHKIVWEGPDINEDKIIRIKGNDNNGIITVTKSETSITSTLKLAGVPKFKYKITIPFSYTCKMLPSPDNLQVNFPIYSIKAVVAPKIHPQKLKPVNYQEDVEVYCTVSYNNIDNNLQLFLILSLLKDGKYLVNKSFPYRKSYQTETIKHTVKVKSFRDGGNYVCQWILKHERSSISDSNTMVLSILPTLTGQKQKEISFKPGVDGGLVCEIDVVPLNITWTVNGAVINANNSKYRISTTDMRLLFIFNVNFNKSLSFICSAKNELNNEVVQQEIIVYVKSGSDSVSVLWPVLGTTIAAILVSIIMGN